MTKNIDEFLNQRKENWLEKKRKDAKLDTVTEAMQQEATEQFKPGNWLAGAARRAGWLSMSSHPGKYSHPRAAVSAIIVSAQRCPDGLLRSGNIDVPLDVFGNAAALDVYTFLDTPLSDGQPVINHLEQQTPLILSYLAKHVSQPEEQKKICQQLLTIKQDDVQPQTSQLVKQVYFPVGEDYHLLSLLTPSGIVTALKKRLDALRFSEEIKPIRELRRQNKFSDVGLSDVYNLTQTEFMRSKPQNISQLNNQNGGLAYLLPSCPPTIERRSLRLPSKDFFTQTLYTGKFDQRFAILEKQMSSGLNNVHIRQKIVNTLISVFEDILLTAVQLQQEAPGWTQRPHYQALPQYQKIWLDSAYQHERLNQSDWQTQVADTLAKWFITTFTKWAKTSHQPAHEMGDGEFQFLNQLVHDTFRQKQEYL